MLKRLWCQRRGRGLLSQLRMTPSPISAALLCPQLSPGASPHSSPSTLLRRRCPLIATNVAINTATSFLAHQRRSMSSSYAARVPCVRFGVNTKDLARVTDQPDLPPTANIYVIDVRKKHNKKKKPNTRKIMSAIIDAHRAEAGKAVEEHLIVEDAHPSTPSLIFLVKSDDTAAQATRRQQVMDGQLQALNALGEFRVCVLSGPKTRHWSTYVASTERADTLDRAAPSPVPTSDVARANAGAGVEAATTAQNVVSADSYASLNVEPQASPVSSSPLTQTIHGAEGDREAEVFSAGGVAVDTANNTMDEEEWEEVEEEVEEDDEGEEGDANVHTEGQVHMRYKEVDVASPHDAVDEEETATASLEAKDALLGTATSSSPSADDIAGAQEDEGDALSSYDETPSKDAQRLDTAESIPGVPTLAADEGDVYIDREDDVIEASSSASSKAQLSNNTTAQHEFSSSSFPGTQDARQAASSKAPAGAASPPVEPVEQKEKEEEEELEEFDIDGPLASQDTASAGLESPSTTSGSAPLHDAADVNASRGIAAAAGETSSPMTHNTSFSGSATTSQEPTSIPSVEVAGENSNSEQILKDPAQPQAADVRVDDSAASTVLEKVTESAFEEAPPRLTPTPLPQPITPMPAYPTVSARLYNGAATSYLSDRAMRELPICANVLVIDRLDWHDGTIAEIDAALAEVDPVAGHMLLYRDAYAPQSECTVKESLVFRDALVPFIFAFRTALSREAAQVEQRRFVDALRSRPAGLSAEQQAALAGQRDRCFVCVLCAEESERGGENPLEDPELRSRQAAAAAAHARRRAAEDSAPQALEHEEENNSAFRGEKTNSDQTTEVESSDGLGRLWDMMNAGPTQTTELHNDLDGRTESNSNTPSPSSSLPSRYRSKAQFSVPVPTYDGEDDDDLTFHYADNRGESDPIQRNSGEDDPVISSSSRRSKNARSSRSSSYDPSSPAPPTSLPDKPTPPPLSLGLLGFETVLFGKQNAYAHMSHTEHGRHSGNRRGGAGKSAAEYEDAELSETHSANTSPTEDSTEQESHDDSSSITADAHNAAPTPKPKRGVSHRGKGKSKNKRRGRGKATSEAAERRGDAGAASLTNVETHDEDAALEDFILSLYKDDDATLSKTRKDAKKKRGSAQDDPGAVSAVQSARKLLKSARRMKKF